MIAPRHASHRSAATLYCLRMRRKKIMAKVEIYTSVMCPYCTRALALLKAKNIAFEQIDVSMSSALRQTMRSRAGGRTSVPQIFIDDTHIGGCDDLMALESAGHLDALLRG